VCDSFGHDSTAETEMKWIQVIRGMHKRTSWQLTGGDDTVKAQTLNLRYISTICFSAAFPELPLGLFSDLPFTPSHHSKSHHRHLTQSPQPLNSASLPYIMDPYIVDPDTVAIVVELVRIARADRGSSLHKCHGCPSSVVLSPTPFLLDTPGL
jgi:hypothetical protein